MEDKKTLTVVLSREALVARTKRDGRSLYNKEAKQVLIEASLQPGVSVAGMALAHGLNANVLHKWLTRERKARRERAAQHSKTRSPSIALGAANAPTTVKVTKSTNTNPRLLPVMMVEPEAPVSAPKQLIAMGTSSTTPIVSPARTALVIEIGGARIVVEGVIDRVALSAVIDCLREAGST